MIFGIDQNKWQRWFAWHPVFISEGAYYNHIVWLQMVEKRRESSKYPWDYRLIITV